MDASDLVRRLEAAWNAHDAAAFAEPFAEDAEFIHILGGGGTGRAAIEAGHVALFHGLYAGSEVSYRLLRSIPLGAEAVILLLHQRLRFQAEGTVQEVECHPSLVVARDGEGWVIRFFQNTVIAGSGSPGATAAIAGAHPHRPR